MSPVTFDSSASLPGSNHVRQVPSHLPTKSATTGRAGGYEEGP